MFLRCGREYDTNSNGETFDFGFYFDDLRVLCCLRALQRGLILKRPFYCSGSTFRVSCCHLSKASRPSQPIQLSFHDMLLSLLWRGGVTKDVYGL